MRKRRELFRIDKAVGIGDLFRTGDLEALPPLERGNEIAGFQEAVGRSGIEPGIAAPHQGHAQAPLIQIDPVHIGDFQLPARRGFQVSRYIDDVRVIEIKAGYRPVGFRSGGLLLDGDGPDLLIELDDTVPFGSWT